MENPRIDVAYIARLAKLELTPDETNRFTEDLGQVLRYVAQLEQLDTTGIDPMYHPLPVFDALRPDKAGTSLPQQEALANAPSALDGQFRVPKVVESAH